MPQPVRSRRVILPDNAPGGAWVLPALFRFGWPNDYANVSAYLIMSCEMSSKNQKNGGFGNEHDGHGKGHGHGGPGKVNEHDGHGKGHGHGGPGKVNDHDGHGKGGDGPGDGCAPCFTRGTLIATEQGQIPVEALVAGMKVKTADRGLQDLRWVGSRVLDAQTLQENPQLQPIRIRSGALGNGLPLRDLVVSPQHRILVRSKIAQKMFGAAEILVAARQLLQLDGIDIAWDLASVEYFHFLFDRHEVVFSEGAETESLYTGPEALKSVGEAAREEIFTILPELRDRVGDEAPQGARLLVSGRQGRKLAVRHAQHHKALVQ